MNEHKDRTVLEKLEEWQDAHRVATRPIVIIIVAVCLLGGVGIVWAQNADGATVKESVSVAVAPAPTAALAGGCDYSPRQCDVLDRAKQMWHQFRNGGCGDCEYTDLQRATIQNNAWLNKSLVATSQLRNPHSKADWNLGNRGTGTQKAAAINCGAGAIPWEFWAWHREPSMFGFSTLYEFHWHADVCFRLNAAGNNWNAMSISSDTWTEDRDCVNCSWGGSVLDHRSNIPDTWVQDIRTEKVAITIPVKYGFVNNVDPQVKANIFGPSNWDLIPGY